MTDGPVAGDFYNAMPHDMHLYDAATRQLVLRVPPAADAPRLTASERYDQPTDSAPIRGLEGRVTPPPSFAADFLGTPPPTSAAFARASCVLVSPLLGRIARDAGHTRWHGKLLVSPNTGPGFAVRDDEGRVRGCTHLIVWALGAAR